MMLKQPEGYTPVQPGGFDEGDLHLEAWQPESETVTQCFILQAYRDDSLLEEREVTISHDTRWGMDKEDWANLEMETEKLINELKA